MPVKVVNYFLLRAISGFFQLRFFNTCSHIYYFSYENTCSYVYIFRMKKMPFDSLQVKACLNHEFANFLEC